MTRLTTWRVTTAIVGLAIFGYGVRSDNDMIRWVGIACLVVAFLLRFFGKPRPR